MKYLIKLTKSIRAKEKLPTIREVMTIDEIMQHLVNYGVYGKVYARVKEELKRNEDSEFLDGIIEKIDGSKIDASKKKIQREPISAATGMRSKESTRWFYK